MRQPTLRSRIKYAANPELHVHSAQNSAENRQLDCVSNNRAFDAQRARMCVLHVCWDLP